MICRFVDQRGDFFAVLEEKLGEEFSLTPAAEDDYDSLGASEVLICSLPASEDSRFPANLKILQRLVRNPAGIPVVAFLSTDEREVMREAVSAGAFDHFVESGSMEELRLVLRRAARFQELRLELQRLQAGSFKENEFSSMVGTDETMRPVFSLASKVASTDANVLITGESGTGKELLARSIHSASPRANEPFVAVACSSLPETLIEAELFGHERGAFTGASAARLGRFEAAGQGTIFLDEVGDLAPALQVKLLRVLQERTLERLGSNQSRPMEARVICATHRNLQQLAKDGTFRLDLYYRVNTVEIVLPPLRERRDDIAVLAHSFLQGFNQRHHRTVQRISAAALCALEEYAWPGNVRELQNVIERAIVICEGSEIAIEHLPSQFAAWPEAEAGSSFDEEVRNFKRRLVLRTLAECGNNKVQAARFLKIARSSIHRLIEELDIPPTVH
ncbi:MAG TPA: sigma-54 dependent transcriptional regulator [Terriglobales bacterium]|nr:sigma-54 dependent transcriptional regulator [Terriglobales bacterium]